jgi:hypothetical protein
MIRLSIASSASIAIAFAAVLASVGCASRNDDDVQLDSTEQALVADNDAAEEADESLEASIDDGLGGGEADAPAQPSEEVDEGRVGVVRLRAPRHVSPAGCLVSSAAGNVITHTFSGCTNLRGRKLDGVVTSTWSFVPGKAKVVHSATDFKIDKATFSGSRTVDYAKDGGKFTVTRIGSWSGTLEGGKPIKHEANFVTVYDAASKCYVRNGTASSSVGQREFSRTVENVERCRPFAYACPKGGKKTIKRNDRSLSIEFSGGRAVEVTRPNGTSVIRQLACVE